VKEMICPERPTSTCTKNQEQMMGSLQLLDIIGGGGGIFISFMYDEI
jgi:hypothetical protein